MVEEEDGRLLWQVLGGGDKGGILVRKAQATNSPEVGRVSTNAWLEEIEVVGERLHYKKIIGDGPDFGWVSIKTKGKNLVERRQGPPPTPPKVIKVRPGSLREAVGMQIQVATRSRAEVTSSANPVHRTNVEVASTTGIAPAMAPVPDPPANNFPEKPTAVAAQLTGEPPAADPQIGESNPKLAIAFKPGADTNSPTMEVGIVSEKSTTRMVPTNAPISDFGAALPAPMADTSKLKATETDETRTDACRGEATNTVATGEDPNINMPGDYAPVSACNEEEPLSWTVQGSNPPLVVPLMGTSNCEAELDKIPADEESDDTDAAVPSNVVETSQVAATTTASPTRDPMVDEDVDGAPSPMAAEEPIAAEDPTDEVDMLSEALETAGAHANISTLRSDVAGSHADATPTTAPAGELADHELASKPASQVVLEPGAPPAVVLEPGEPPEEESTADMDDPGVVSKVMRGCGEDASTGIPSSGEDVEAPAASEQAPAPTTMEENENGMPNSAAEEALGEPAFAAQQESDTAADVRAGQETTIEAPLLALDWSDKEVVLEAIRRDGLALQSASEELRWDRKVIIEALCRDYRAYEWVPWELRADPEFFTAAVKNAGLWMQESLHSLQHAIDGALQAFTLQAARELVWQLVKVAEQKDFAYARAALERYLEGHDEALYITKIALLYAHHLELPAPESCGEFTKMQEALRLYWDDIEMQGLTARFERAMQLPPGSTLALGEEDTCGSKYPDYETERHIKKRGTWEKIRCDLAFHEDAEVMVVPPEEKPTEPAPALLYLLGAGHFNSRQAFLSGDIERAFENELLRKHFYVIVPKPHIRSGTIYYTGQRWHKEWSHDACWHLFTECLRRLGPEKVNPARLYVCGNSQGACGTWHIVCKYGSMIAAAQPMAGKCEWPEGAWPKGEDIKPEVLKNIRSCAVRASHVDSDSYAPPPKRDMEYMTYDLEERSYDIAPLGWNMQTRLPCKVRKWVWPDSGKPFELWWVKGPICDGGPFWEYDNHLVWYRQITNPIWGWVAFFMEHTVPPECQWRFDDPPLVVDSAEREAALAELGYYDTPEKNPLDLKREQHDLGALCILEDVEALLPKVREEFLLAVRRVARDHEVMALLQLALTNEAVPETTDIVLAQVDEVERGVQTFRKICTKTVETLPHGQELWVTLQLTIPEPPAATKFGVVDKRPWDKRADCMIRPGSPIMALKIRAAEILYVDAKKANTFEVGIRPKPGMPDQRVLPLPIDAPLTEEHLELDVCEEHRSPGHPVVGTAPELTITVLLKHHERYEEDGYFPSLHNVRRGTTVGQLKKLVAPKLEKAPSDIGICLATAVPDSDSEHIGVLYYYLSDSVMLTEEHWLLQVGKPGMMNVSLDMAGVIKEFSIDKGTNIGKLKWIMANGNEKKARFFNIGVPAKRPGEAVKPLPDSTVITEAQHKRLQLC